jgi:hypothetical protein
MQKQVDKCLIILCRMKYLPSQAMLVNQEPDRPLGNADVKANVENGRTAVVNIFSSLPGTWT